MSILSLHGCKSGGPVGVFITLRAVASDRILVIAWREYHQRLTEPIRTKSQSFQKMTKNQLPTQLPSNLWNRRIIAFTVFLAYQIIILQLQSFAAQVVGHPPIILVARLKGKRLSILSDTGGQASQSYISLTARVCLTNRKSTGYRSSIAEYPKILCNK
jgi:hypothetical protein